MSWHEALDRCAVQNASLPMWKTQADVLQVSKYLSVDHTSGAGTQFLFLGMVYEVCYKYSESYVYEI